MNLCFSGAGYLASYYIGVASCFQEYAPHVLLNKITGTSGGALIACGIASGVPIDILADDTLEIAEAARRSMPLGPLHPEFDINKLIAEKFAQHLPEDAHVRCTDRLFVSVTRFPDGENLLLSKFSTRDVLIQTMVATCFIPFYSGLKAPKIDGVEYIDGGLTNNLPLLDDQTITVSPLSGKSDICPKDSCFSLGESLYINFANTTGFISTANGYRLSRLLYPASRDELIELRQRGFDDTLKFMVKRNLIGSTRCIIAPMKTTLISNTELDLHERQTSVSDDEWYDANSTSMAERIQSGQHDSPAVATGTNKPQELFDSDYVSLENLSLDSDDDCEVGEIRFQTVSICVDDAANTFNMRGWDQIHVSQDTAPVKLILKADSRHSGPLPAPVSNNLMLSVDMVYKLLQTSASKFVNTFELPVRASVSVLKGIVGTVLTKTAGEQNCHSECTTSPISNAQISDINPSGSIDKAKMT